MLCLKNGSPCMKRHTRTRIQPTPVVGNMALYFEGAERSGPHQSAMGRYVTVPTGKLKLTLHKFHHHLSLRLRAQVLGSGTVFVRSLLPTVCRLDPCMHGPLFLESSLVEMTVMEQFWPQRTGQRFAL